MVSIKSLRCQAGCANCYERRIRRARGADREPDVAKLVEVVKAWPKIEGSTSAPYLHGGEPLLFSDSELERLFEAAVERFGHVGVQTNGIAITGARIALFKKWKVDVGVSLDGDTPELNRGRWDAPGMAAEDAERGTRRVVRNIKDLIEAGVPVSLMSTLWNYNARGEALSEFIEFVLGMYALGIRHHTFHAGTAYELPEAELSMKDLGLAFRHLTEVCFQEPGRDWRPFRDVVDLMLGAREAVCVFNGCDPWRTSSEEPAFEDGSIGCCLRAGASVDGIVALRADAFQDTRSIFLPQLAQDLGGCKGCRFWPVCRGNCPGSAIGGDWRLRTRHCEAWKSLYEDVERRLRGLFPNAVLAQDYDSRPGIDLLIRSVAGSASSRCKAVSIERLKEMEKKAGVAQAAADASGHGDRGHGDSDDPAWRAANPGWEKQAGTRR